MTDRLTELCRERAEIAKLLLQFEGGNLVTQSDFDENRLHAGGAFEADTSDERKIALTRKRDDLDRKIADAKAEQS